MRIIFPATLAFIFLLSLDAFSTHLRAADIIVEQECNSLKYKITIRVYLNTRSSTPFGGNELPDGHLNFGDFSPLDIIHISETVGPEPRPDLGTEISVATYTTFHTYSKAGTYKITYFERDRSSGILNIPNSGDVAYSTFTIINAQTQHCNQVPQFLVPPVDRACKGVVFYHSAGATDVDGDSISYALAIPFKDSTSAVEGYRSPDHFSFYSDYEHGNEAKNAKPIFKIDAVNGLITWDAPGLQGEYNIAFRVIEWRFDPGTNQFFKISENTRDMQIVVEDCLNNRPTLAVPADICVEAGKVVMGKFIATDPDNHPIKFELFSSIFDGAPDTSPATYEPMTTEFRPSNPPAELNIEWKTNCSHVRDQVYQVVIKVTDDPPSGPKLVFFHTWNIRVIAPAPAWSNIEPDLVNRSAVLEWQEYQCSNAEKIQLWRKVGSFPFLPGQCVAGLSVHKGYTLIREFDPAETAFIDTNNGKKLSVGAQYCYRLVAVFKLPSGGKSYVSKEVCVGPILADAPVITNVTVNKTDRSNGEVEIRWIKPFDISPEQYPEPYQYEVYRSEGFDQQPVPINISGRVENETLFIDNNANTSERIYNYQVVLYSMTQNNDQYNAIDTSAVASSVRLAIEPGQGKMLLKWQAEVPWSNVNPLRPWHRIYRGVAGDTKEDLKLIDSVEVSETGFEYTDKGNFKNEPIREDIYYSYYVEAIGSYGNNFIPALFNDSQVSSSYPIGNLPVCTPLLQVGKTDCESFLTSTSCGQTLFENELSWEVPDTPGCRKDIVSFNLYYTEKENGPYTLLQSFTDQTQFKDPVVSLARCYRMSAVNSQGYESPLSDPMCNENCPYFELPNVFTPNGDGCNDLFTSYMPSENPEECPVQEFSKCPRFVQHVYLKIFNRWGKVVHEYQSSEKNSVSINWNGRDRNGTLLESGIYFYVADVEFISIDPALKHKRVKGWLNILH
jgi:gliding motility-associated-like protein